MPPPDPAATISAKRPSLAAIATIAWTRRRCIDGTAEAQAVLAAVAQSGERFGAGHVIDILRGADTQKIMERGP